jgi:hypothetical protein
MRLFSKLRRVAARSAALVIGVAASIPSRVGSLIGDFTLPVTAKWNRRILPAGEYRFAVSPLMSRPWVYVLGDHEAIVFHVASKEWAAGAPGGLLCLLYDDSGYHVRSLKLPGGKEILYFESRTPVPARSAPPGWRTVSGPHEAPGRPGVLYIPLRPNVPAIGSDRRIPQRLV